MKLDKKFTDRIIFVATKFSDHIHCTYKLWRRCHVLIFHYKINLAIVQFFFVTDLSDAMGYSYVFEFYFRAAKYMGKLKPFAI